MRVKMRNVGKKDNKKVVNYIEAVRSQGKDVTAMHLYASDEDLEKWQEEADAVGWPLQLWILSVVNGHLKNQEEERRLNDMSPVTGT